MDGTNVPLTKVKKWWRLKPRPIRMRLLVLDPFPITHFLYGIGNGPGSLSWH